MPWLKDKLSLWESEEHQEYLSILSYIGKKSMVSKNGFEVQKDKTVYMVKPPVYSDIEHIIKAADPADPNIADYTSYKHIMLARKITEANRVWSDRRLGHAETVSNFLPLTASILVIQTPASVEIIAGMKRVKRVAANTQQHVKNAAKQHILKRLRDEADFPFQTREECESNKRSSTFYLSKADLIKRINDHAELKDAMPKNLAGMTKEKICDVLFS